MSAVHSPRLYALLPYSPWGAFLNRPWRLYSFLSFFSPSSPALPFSLSSLATVGTVFFSILLTTRLLSINSQNQLSILYFHLLSIDSSLRHYHVDNDTVDGFGCCDSGSYTITFSD